MRYEGDILNEITEGRPKPSYPILEVSLGLVVEDTSQGPKIKRKG